MKFFAKFRLVLAFLISTFIFSLLYFLLPIFPPLSYVPYWSGGRPEFDIKTQYGILILMFPMFWLLALIGQLVLVLPFVLYLKSTKFKNLFVVSIYVMFAFAITYYFFQPSMFQAPALMTGKGGLSEEFLPMSEVDPLRYASIYQGWRKDVVRQCIIICSSGLIAGVAFWTACYGTYNIPSRIKK